MILKPHSIFCNKEGRRKIKEKGVWTAEVFECQCLKLQKIKGTRSSYNVIRGLDCFACEASLHSSFAGSIKEAQLTGGVQIEKTREGKRTLKSHVGQPLRKFVMLLEKINQGQRIMKLSDSCEM